MAGLSQRSSVASSLFTGVVGWFGGTVVTTLLVGQPVPVLELASVLAMITLGHVAVLRLFFEPMGMERGVPRGTALGALIGLPFGVGLVGALPILRPHAPIVIPAGAVMGAAVGFYLSYFHRDDRRLEAEQGKGPGEADYGRDATWWEPFPFGGLVFALAFAPTSVDVAFHALFLGTTIGVLAAAASHFVVTTWDDARLAWATMVIVGAVLGVGAGWLMSPFETLLPPVAHGLIAGALAWAGVFWRGQALAATERGTP